MSNSYITTWNTQPFIIYHLKRWSLNLRALLGTAGSGNAGGRVCLDVGKAVWQKVEIFI